MINEYEKEVLNRIEERISEFNEIENAEIYLTQGEFNNKESDKIFDNVFEEVVKENIEDTSDISTNSMIFENKEHNVDLIDEIVSESSISELEEYNEVNDNKKILDETLFTAGVHPSTASPSIVIHSTYDRYEIYSGENPGTVIISDNNGNYYNGNSNIKIVRNIADSHNNNSIILQLSSDIQVFDFDESNESYVLLPEGFVDDLIIKQCDSEYLSPNEIKRLNYVKVNLVFNGTDLGTYDLYEYFILYYLSCYEGVLGDYYY